MKKKTAKQLIALLTASVLVVGFPTAVSAEWVVSDGGRWWNYNPEQNPSWSVGWELLDGSWYYFDEDGWMRTGWVLDKDTWYYMNPSGDMASDTWIDGTYYVGTNGAMYTDAWTPDGYYVGSDGAWVFDVTPSLEIDGEWKLDSSGWWWSYYRGGYPKGEWKEIKGDWYYFQDNGYIMQESWLEADDSKWYYFGSDGAMLEGTWSQINGNYYYFNGDSVKNGFKTGEMLHSTWIKYNAKTYHMAADGHMASQSWVHKPGATSDYYVGEDGAFIANYPNSADLTNSFARDYIGSTTNRNSYRWECKYRANGKNNLYYVEFTSIQGNQVTMNIGHMDADAKTAARQEGIVGTLTGNDIQFTFNDGRYQGTGSISLNGGNIYVTSTCGRTDSHFHNDYSLCTGGTSCVWTNY